MALNLSLLTTRAECDEVLEALAAELDTYQQRDSNLGYADRQATRVTTNITGQLAGVNAEIAGIEALLATVGITKSLRKTNENKLRRVNDRKANLEERGEARTGSAAFLADVDAEQVDAQVMVLTNAQKEVTDHRATLSV